MTISIIIPVYNEENTVDYLLEYLYKYSNFQIIKQIIVVDGGSKDNTLLKLQKYPLVVVLNSDKGRAKQMNTAANVATSDYLYFLHVDSFPPKNYELEIIKKIKSGFVAGCFKMKFNNKHIVLRISQYFTKFNFIACRGGDQSLFVSKKIFNELNGYNENLMG